MFLRLLHPGNCSHLDSWLMIQLVPWPHLKVDSVYIDHFPHPYDCIPKHPFFSPPLPNYFWKTLTSKSLERLIWVITPVFPLNSLTLIKHFISTAQSQWIDFVFAVGRKNLSWICLSYTSNNASVIFHAWPIHSSPRTLGLSSYSRENPILISFLSNHAFRNSASASRSHVSFLASRKSLMPSSTCSFSVVVKLWWT